MFQVFLAILKITPSFYRLPPLIKNSLPFHQCTPFIIIPHNQHLIPPQLGTGVIETTDSKLHAKLSNHENFKNLKKLVDLASNLDKTIEKEKRKENRLHQYSSIVLVFEIFGGFWVWLGCHLILSVSSDLNSRLLNLWLHHH